MRRTLWQITQVLAIVIAIYLVLGFAMVLLFEVMA